MKIFSQQLCVNKNQPVVQNRKTGSYAGYSRLTCDTFSPSFCGMKKSQFSNLDFAIVEKFKAPIEKFKSMEDFQAWAGDKYYSICMKNFGGRTGEVRYKRESMVCDWDQALNSENYTDAEKLLILDGVTKELKPNNDNICPVYNREILEKTFSELVSGLNDNRKLQFDFGKMYRKNLVDMYSESSSKTNDVTKWIVIPSKDNDPEHFKENVEKLQSISTPEMCTKFSGANFHLRNGDIHVYLVDGKPKVLLRLNDGVVQEINGEHNDYRIPTEYVKLTEEYMMKNDLVTTEKADEMLANSRVPEETKEVKEEVADKKEDSGIIGFFKSLFKF